MEVSGKLKYWVLVRRIESFIIVIGGKEEYIV